MHKHGRPSIAHALGFLLIALIIHFKGVLMKLKNIPYTISGEKLIFTFTYEVKNFSPCNFRGIAYFLRFFLTFYC